MEEMESVDYIREMDENYSDFIRAMFRNEMHKFHQERGYPPTDCVIPAWMLEELKANCEKLLKDKMPKDNFEYRGVRLHPSHDEMDMYFYRAFKGWD